MAPGTTVRQDIDFNRRWDHMQQHTGQHLLSAVMDTYENLGTLGWGMGADGGMNYVDLPRKPSQSEMQAIQDRCNEIIRDNVSITVNTPSMAESNGSPSNYDLEKGLVRVISIGDFDHNAYVPQNNFILVTNRAFLAAVARIWLKPLTSPLFCYISHNPFTARTAACTSQWATEPSRHLQSLSMLFAPLPRLYLHQASLLN